MGVLTFALTFVTFASLSKIADFWQYGFIATFIEWYLKVLARQRERSE